MRIPFNHFKPDMQSAQDNRDLFEGVNHQVWGPEFEVSEFEVRGSKFGVRNLIRIPKPGTCNPLRHGYSAAFLSGKNR